MSTELAWNAFDLEAYKNKKQAEVDAAVERERLKMITPGEGQAMVYLLKREEAKTFLADPTTDLSLIPHVAKESEKLGLTLTEAAQRIVDQAEIWANLSSEIESERQRVKAEIKAATTVDEVLTACKMDWSQFSNVQI